MHRLINEFHLIPLADMNISPGIPDWKNICIDRQKLSLSRKWLIIMGRNDELVVEQSELQKRKNQTQATKIFSLGRTLMVESFQGEVKFVVLLE